MARTLGTLLYVLLASAASSWSAVIGGDPVATRASRSSRSAFEPALIL